MLTDIHSGWKEIRPCENSEWIPLEKANVCGSIKK